MITKLFKEEYKQINLCKWLRLDTETCQIGCEELNVIRGNICPFDLNDEALICPCYKR
jgi:hypothetical protein